MCAETGHTYNTYVDYKAKVKNKEKDGHTHLVLVRKIMTSSDILTTRLLGNLLDKHLVGKAIVALGLS